MVRAVNFVGAVVLLAASCVHAGHRSPPAYEDIAPGTGWTRQGRWRPAEGVVLAFGVRCSGAGSERACRVEISERVAGVDRPLSVEPCGTAIPIVGVDSDPAVLVLVGEDARGGWRQLARYVPDRAALEWTRRRYDDGL
jgi:hypothetical protein